MSAIGVFLRLGPNGQHVESCGRMLEAQRAYGPDDRNESSLGDCALGRNLYRCLPEDIYDEGPLVGRDGGVLLVADVRLDNRDELITQLGVADPPDKISDSALLLIAYERWGERLLDFILGDYAFAVWDSDKRRLFMARDPLGQRPLCYHRAPDFFAAASMPKGLHALPRVAREADPIRIAEFVGGVHYAGPRTFYKNVSRLEPGHALVVEDGALRTYRWWKPQRRELQLGTFDDYRDAFRAELDRAVACRLRGAGPIVAAHLSSGWDSSAVATTAARLLALHNRRVAAFTAVPRAGNRTGAPFGRITDEGVIAAETAALYANVDHFRVEGSGASPVADLGRMVELFDRPYTNICNEVWLAQIRRAATDRGARVLLTGEVGNWTISAAPPTLLADLLREGRWRSWWREARAKLDGGNARYRGVLANSFGPWLPHVVWSLFAPMSAAGAGADVSALRVKWRAAAAQRQREIGGLLGRPPRDSFAEAVRGLSRYDFGQFRKGALAGWGIDERDPTGDRRLIEFCLSLPIDMLLKDGVRRPLARAALSDRLPAAVLQERSKGYQAADWHEGLTADLANISSLIETIANDPRSAAIVDTDALRAWVAAWPRGGWEELAIMARYRIALLQALSAGHFVAST